MGNNDLNTVEEIGDEELSDSPTPRSQSQTSLNDWSRDDERNMYYDLICCRKTLINFLYDKAKAILKLIGWW